MSAHRNHRPRWNMLHLFVVLMAAMLLLEHSLKLDVVAHKLVLVLLVLGFYSLVGMWVGTNATALQRQGEEAASGLQRRPPTNYGTTPIQGHLRESASLHRYQTRKKRNEL